MRWSCCPPKTCWTATSSRAHQRLVHLLRHDLCVGWPIDTWYRLRLRHSLGRRVQGHTRTVGLRQGRYGGITGAGTKRQKPVVPRSGSGLRSSRWRLSRAMPPGSSWPAARSFRPHRHLERGPAALHAAATTRQCHRCKLKAKLRDYDARGSAAHPPAHRRAARPTSASRRGGRPSAPGAGHPGCLHRELRTGMGSRASRRGPR